MEECLNTDRYSVSVLDLMTDSMLISYASVNLKGVEELATEIVKAEEHVFFIFMVDIKAGKGGRLVSAEGLEKRYILNVDPD